MSVYNKDKCRVWIEKRPVNGKEDCAVITLNGRGEEIWVYSESFDNSGMSGNAAFGFADMHFDFPVPFRIGDILYDPDLSSGFEDIPCEPPTFEPFVYMGREPDDTFPERTAVCKYRQAADGIIYKDKDIWEDLTSLEYCPKEKLVDRNGKVLVALSGLVRGNIDATTFANVYAYILADDHAKQMKHTEEQRTYRR